MVMDLTEARKELEECLSEELRKEYFLQLRQWFSFKTSITKDEFDRNVRKLFVNEEQIRCHNYFMLAILSKVSSNRVKTYRTNNEKGIFEYPEYSDYVQPSSPSMHPSHLQDRSAAAELFMPDNSFVSIKASISAWDNGLEVSDDGVAEIIVYACQVFVKNIITAMVSRKKGYKIRDKKFQYGFNQPIPDPFIRNFNNVLDDTQESKVVVANEDDSFVPKYKQSLENIEQQVAFAYSCSKRQQFNNILTVQLLYDTLRENPGILGLNTVQNCNTLKLGLQLDD